MAYYAHTVPGTMESVDVVKGELNGPDIEIGGITFHQKTRVKLGYAYTGDPSDAALAHPKLKVMTSRLDPYPGSQMDEWTVRPPEKCGPRKDKLPRRGPGGMAHRETLGAWPDVHTIDADRMLEARLANPAEVTRALLKRQGMVDGHVLEAKVARSVQVVKEGRRDRPLPHPDELIAEGALAATGADGPTPDVQAVAANEQQRLDAKPEPAPAPPPKQPEPRTDGGNRRSERRGGRR